GNSVNMISKIRAIQKNVKILIFSAYDEENYGLRYINSGADGYLNKLCSEEEFITAITSILTTGKYVSDGLRDKIINNVIYKKSTNPLDALSNREMEVAKLLVKGDGNHEISHKLNIQSSTISTFKKRIFEKLEITNVLGLAQIFNLYQD
ncbi:LuxR C-terminal-related transcriptional regulator, partial [Flavobacterium collinsii]